MNRFFYYLVCLICLNSSINANHPLKMYVFYTPSHTEMFENWFLPSIHPDDNYEIIVECHRQECPTGSFMESGWIDTMKHKVDLVIRAIHENWGEVFVHADVDIQFFGPTQKIIEELMINKDLLAQKDEPGGTLCAGFFACRANEKTLKLWQEIRKNLSANRNDQQLLNDLIRNKNPFQIIWGYFPTDKFIGGGTFTGKRWYPGVSLILPRNILMHHANYTAGIENKIEQLNYVKKIIEPLS